MILDEQYKIAGGCERGTICLGSGIYPVSHLLDMEVDRILGLFKDSQREEFVRIIETSSEILDSILPVKVYENSKYNQKKSAFKDLFARLHDHIAEHPLWLHPFYQRIFNAEFDLEQLKRFTKSYFNQVKNRQKDATPPLSQWHVTSFSGMDFERTSKLTQVILSQLVAREFLPGIHPMDESAAATGTPQPHSPILMFRRLFEALHIEKEGHDEPMVQEAMDHILIQRIIAADSRFARPATLALYAPAMEWGGPDFFSFILSGLLRFLDREKLSVTAGDLLLFISHIKYHVMRSVSVIFATLFYIDSEEEFEKMIEVVNALMAGQYAMMTGIYKYVFNEDCGNLMDIYPDMKYANADPQIGEKLIQHRKTVSDCEVIAYRDYVEKKDHPFFIFEKKTLKA